MSEKKKFGKILALVTAAGAVAAGVSYFLKYKSFHKELDQDFHDFESADEDDFDGTLPHESETASRNYVPLGEKKADIQEAAEEITKEVKEAASETVDAVADAAKTAADTAEDAAKTASEDTDALINAAMESVKAAQDEAKKAAEETSAADSATIEDDSL